MKLLYKILRAPLVAVGCLIVTGVASHVSIKALTAQFEVLRGEKLAAAAALGEVQTRMAAMNTLLYRTMALIESADPKSIGVTKQDLLGRVADIQARLKTAGSHVDPQAAKALEGVAAQVAKYEQNATRVLVTAESSPGMALTMLGSAESNFKASFAAVQLSAKAVDDDATQMAAEVARIETLALGLIVGLTLCAVAVSLALAVWSARDIVARLASATRVSEAVARGELNVDTPVGTDDELGQLQRSLRATVERLGEMLGNIQQASGSIGVASSEVAAGSQDLSARTERAASSLQQTAATMMQLSDSVHHSADAAHKADRLAGSASEVATRGGAMVAQVVQTMTSINDSSRRIGDIVGVIDGIAFQTNILALNAAVEAARAGEQGRGFAVVAAEVRSLAHRSATAAREIKSLINENVEKVDTGARLVSDTGVTMDEIVATVQRVSAMIGEVSAASALQSGSLAEVHGGVRLLDEMTQHNAALVEESAAAAESLKEQARRLSGVVGTFTLRAAGATPFAIAGT